ncbi:hypothetical protein Tco_0671743 [Tanacetum coccineum]
MRDNALTELRKKFEKAKKERDDLKLTLEKFKNSSKNLSKLLEIQVSDKFKNGVGYDSQVFDSQVNDKYKIGEGYHAVPLPYTGNFMTSKPNLVLADKEEYVFSESITSVPAVATSEVKTNLVVTIKQTARQNSSKAAVSANTARPINTAYPRPTMNYERPSLNVFNKAHSHVRRPFNKFTTYKNSNFNEKVNTVKGNVTTVRPKAVVSDNKGNEANAVKASACWGNPQLELQEKGVIDSGYSRYMTGNKSYLSNYEEIDGGFVAFGGSTKGGKITGKGKIRTGSGPEWLFDIDTLTKSMNYKPVVAGNQSNGGVGTKACDNEEKKDVEALENEDSEVLNTEEPIVNQENDENVNSTNNINTVSSTVNTASIEDNVVDENIVYGCADDPNMPNLEEIVYSEDDEGVGAKADMNNLDTFMPISPIPTTRIHKDHPFEQIIRDLHSTPQTRRMTKSVTEHGNPRIKRSKLDRSYARRASAIQVTIGLDLGGFTIWKKNHCQDKYVDDILKKFGFSTVKTASTPMETSKPLVKDENAEDVDVQLYRSMIGSLIIFRYLKGQPKLGLWYPKDSPFNLEAYTNSDYAGASLDRKSTIGGCQFFGRRLISWQCKK